MMLEQIPKQEYQICDTYSKWMVTGKCLTFTANKIYLSALDIFMKVARAAHVAHYSYGKKQNKIVNDTRI